MTALIDTRSALPAPPAKIALERRIKPGAEASFEAWVKALLATADRSAAFQGASVIGSRDGEYAIIVRFASRHDLNAWQTSEEVVALLRAGDAYTSAPDDALVQTGLETWFVVPGAAASIRRPPKWKIALTTWIALLPLVVLLGFVIPPNVMGVARAAVTTAIAVALLTWVIMPRLAALLHPWLFARRQA